MNKSKEQESTLIFISKLLNGDNFIKSLNSVFNKCNKGNRDIILRTDGIIEVLDRS